MMNLSVSETIQKLQDSLREYIEATYHISNPTLIKQRNTILKTQGVIYQEPYIESTPKYKVGKKIDELLIDENIKELFQLISKDSGILKKLIFDPLYGHQSKSIEYSLGKNKSLLVMTGTGSGKTECFLLPILGKLFKEASSSNSFKTSAVRAILLYPMNALVNDQLGRLRKLYADERIVSKFQEYSGRPIRFARYTSRTLYPGVRTVEKDQTRLKSIKDFYVDLINKSQDSSNPKQQEALYFINELKERGKWPGKSDIVSWYGKDGSRWQDKNGQFLRCITLPNDSELLTRHEVLMNPPDVLITNYSMLEYMLMRPIESPIFDKTREWLNNNRKENLYLIVDEAHLYRGAAGTEVAYLLRRLANRLGVSENRIQVICTSASFNDSETALHFASQLTGKDINDIEVIEGELDKLPDAGSGNEKDVEILADINTSDFYSEAIEEKRLEIINKFLEFRGIRNSLDSSKALYDALKNYAPFKLLVNTTMKEATSVNKLCNIIFQSVNKNKATQALTNLIAFGSIARNEENAASLLPCRVHSMHRGLAGLWACLNSNCSCLEDDEKGGPVGKLYSQPRERCECGSRVFELFTCRNCGTAYARAYTNNIKDPVYLWSESGLELLSSSGLIPSLSFVDILLEDPKIFAKCEEIEIDLISGRVNPKHPGSHMRSVFLKALDPNDEDTNREFKPCAVCNKTASYGKTYVQDHQTKGDQPFLALISKQIQCQPPNNKIAYDESFAPLKGRKVLIFSDSRQMAARLAPNLQTLSMKDTLRPLLVFGFERLLDQPMLSGHLNLEDSFLAIIVGSYFLNVRLRPELIQGENFDLEKTVFDHLENGDLNNVNILLTSRNKNIPKELFTATYDILFDTYYGIESLGLASIKEDSNLQNRIDSLPEIPNINNYFNTKHDLVRLWLRCWQTSPGIYFSKMPASWINNRISVHTGSFKLIERILSKDAFKIFKKTWLPNLVTYFTRGTENNYSLLAEKLTLDFSTKWNYCNICKTVQRPYLNNKMCLTCNNPTSEEIDVKTDPVFIARKQYYRSSTLNSLKTPPEPPFSLIAAEHTAQLNSPQNSQIFSIAEKYEMLFQDVNMSLGDNEHAIDVLSCTTTMEVGIDIGTLLGVALRNMPPSRANYQQRAGRAGRRGNALASVTSYASSDSHDDHFFKNPDLLISGEVDDPSLVLDNYDIAVRHILAFLLQKYHRNKLSVDQMSSNPNLFEVLGKVSDFVDSSKLINKDDFFKWLQDNEVNLKKELDSWIPNEISEYTRKLLLENFIKEAKKSINIALREFIEIIETQDLETNEDNQIINDTGNGVDASFELLGSQFNTSNLLERLLYKGVLPKYAFPADVATFYVFDLEKSSQYSIAYKYSPSQSLSIALSQWAPGKTLWIDNKKYRSGAIYTPVKRDRKLRWNDRKLYFECNNCHYATTTNLDKGSIGELRNCEACGSIDSFGPAKLWYTPPGFAHPIDIQEETVLDENVELSYASRAKLTAPSPNNWLNETKITNRIYMHSDRYELLISNTGPRNHGFNYCTNCGRIEPAVYLGSLLGGSHRKPYPDDKEPMCSNPFIARNISLGNSFVSDVSMILFKFEEPIKLIPGTISTNVVLRTLCEAITKAVTQLLELESGEVLAEFRPALTREGPNGKEIEIYIYDTLPGGAGFTRKATDYKINLFELSLKILENCPEYCDNSCYRCLRSYKNKFEHNLLDRKLGADLLKYLISGDVPYMTRDRLNKIISLIWNDLTLQSNYTFKRWHIVEIEGIGSVEVPLYLETSKMKYIIDVHHPLTPGIFSNEKFMDIKNYTLGEYQVLLYDEIVIHKNLPYVTNDILKSLK